MVGVAGVAPGGELVVVGEGVFFFLLRLLRDSVEAEKEKDEGERKVLSRDAKKKLRVQ